MEEVAQRHVCIDRCAHFCDQLTPRLRAPQLLQLGLELLILTLDRLHAQLQLGDVAEGAAERHLLVGRRQLQRTEESADREVSDES